MDTYIFHRLMKFKLYYNLEIINIVEIYSKATINFILSVIEVKLIPTRNDQLQNSQFTLYN